MTLKRDSRFRCIKKCHESQHDTCDEGPKGLHCGFSPDRRDSICDGLQCGLSYPLLVLCWREEAAEVHQLCIQVTPSSAYLAACMQ